MVAPRPRSAVFAASLLAALSQVGCASPHASSAVEAENPAARVAELEDRIRDLERREASANACRSGALKPEERRVLAELVATNQRLLSELSQEGPISTQDSVASFPTSAPPAPESVPTRERLEQLLEEFRGEPLDQSGLSRERREALRVLLRRERTLDTNPWR
jgi:hypothetical protein